MQKALIMYFTNDVGHKSHVIIDEEFKFEKLTSTELDSKFNIEIKSYKKKFGEDFYLVQTSVNFGLSNNKVNYFIQLYKNDIDLIKKIEKNIRKFNSIYAEYFETPFQVVKYLRKHANFTSEKKLKELEKIIIEKFVEMTI